MAAISKTRIANMALSHIGAGHTIEDLDGEVSEEASAVRLWYDYSRLQVLQAFNWGFARTRTTLTTHAEDPPSGVWDYRYQYPDHCAAIRAIENPAGTVVLTQVGDANEGNAIPYTVELDATRTNKTVLTNLAEASVVFTWDLEQENLFSPMFVSTLSHLLAHYIAFTITGKLSVQDRQLRIYSAMIGAAPAADANESVEAPPRDASWIRGRG
ncbi:MAG: hypothetical protein V3V96_15330 [Acidiferrobacterales bacterium]